MLVAAVIMGHTGPDWGQSRCPGGQPGTCIPKGSPTGSGCPSVLVLRSSEKRQHCTTPRYDDRDFQDGPGVLGRMEEPQGSGCEL